MCNVIVPVFQEQDDRPNTRIFGNLSLSSYFIYVHPFRLTQGLVYTWMSILTTLLYSITSPTVLLVILLQSRLLPEVFSCNIKAPVTMSEEWINMKILYRGSAIFTPSAPTLPYLAPVKVKGCQKSIPQSHPPPIPPPTVAASRHTKQELIWHLPGMGYLSEVNKPQWHWTRESDRILVSWFTGK